MAYGNTSVFECLCSLGTRIVPVMDSNKRLLEVAKRLIAAGVNQKVLAGKLGIPPSTFSKWLNGKSDWEPPVTAIDKLAAYRSEVASAFEQETQRAKTPSSTAGGHFPGEERRKENTGPPAGTPERRQA